MSSSGIERKLMLSKFRADVGKALSFTSQYSFPTSIHIGYFRRYEKP